MLRRISHSIMSTACIALLLSVPVMAQFGGLCTYDRFAGTARIDSIIPGLLSQGSNSFQPYFKFSSLSLSLSSKHQFNQDIDYPLYGLYSNPLFVKPGHVYPCTLDLIDSGTCTPRIFYFGNPVSWAGYDTSNIWFFPDSAAAGSSFMLHLIDYSFFCYRYDHISISASDSGIRLGYFAEPDLTARCVRIGILNGITFSIPSLKPGKYPVYSDRLPACYPCRMANTVTLIDTLVVSSASLSQSPIRLPLESADIHAVMWPHGLMRIEWNPPFAGMYSIRLLDIAGRVIWQGEKQIANAGRIITEISLERHQETAGLLLLEISPTYKRTGVTSSIAGGSLW